MICNAQWSYSGFINFRKRIAKACGTDLLEMEGFKENGHPWEYPWIGTLGDLIPFMNHSDCDGHLTAKQCRLAAVRLRQVIELLKCFVKYNESLYDHDIINGTKLAEAMECCALERRHLRFC